VGRSIYEEGTADFSLAARRETLASFSFFQESVGRIHNGPKSARH
jgi:hypothetical protein